MDGSTGSRPWLERNQDVPRVALLALCFGRPTHETEATLAPTSDASTNKAELAAWLGTLKQEIKALFLSGGLYQHVMLKPPHPIASGDWDDVLPREGTA